MAWCAAGVIVIAIIAVNGRMGRAVPENAGQRAVTIRVEHGDGREFRSAGRGAFGPLFPFAASFCRLLRRNFSSQSLTRLRLPQGDFDLSESTPHRLGWTTKTSQENP